MGDAPDYAFPHAADSASRRLELFEERLDPLTTRRIERLGVRRGARCLEIGGGRGSIARWLSRHVGPEGHVTATDLQLDFLSAIEESNVEVLRHDLRTETFPEQSFDLVHARAVLMHLPDDPAMLQRMASWLAPGGWLLLEEPDFGLWLADADGVWAAHPETWHQTFPSGSLSRGRSLLKEIHQLDLVDVEADAEVDVVKGGTPLAEFYRLSIATIAPAAIRAGALTPEHAAAIDDALRQRDFLGCGFVYVGVWGRREAKS